MSSSTKRDGIAVGAATGAYGLSFGAVAVTAGLSVPQACALSLLMFTGASQFAFVGVVAGGGALVAAIATAALLGSRNAFYGLRLSALLRARGPRKLAAAHLVIDESTAMAVLRDDEDDGRTAFWWTGLSVFALWNLSTAVGALAAHGLGDPRRFGIDAAAPAAFLALLSPRLRTRGTLALALAAAALALAATPLVPAGVPVLLAGALAICVGLGSSRVKPA